MSKPKHTPGPWDVGFNGTGKDMQPLMVINQNARPIALITDKTMSDFFKKVPKEIMANAALIAAAPDMLEALEQLIDEMPEKGAITQLTRNEVLDLIAKAKGES